MKSKLYQSHLWIPLLLFIVAFFIRLWYGNTLLIAGDDYSSLLEAQNIGQNLQGLPYFLLLNLWMKISLDPLWLHSLSALISALAVVACWYWLRSRGTFIALGASLLLMISSCAFLDSITLRYYGLYLLASILFYKAYWNLLFKEATARSAGDWLILFFTLILLILSQLLGILVVSLVLFHAAMCYRGSISRWLRLFVAIELGCALVVVIAFMLSSQLRETAYLAFSRIIASSAQTYEGPRGWSLLVFAKLGILFFHFSIGPATYILDYATVVPALLLTFVFCLLGIIRLFREHLRAQLLFAIIVGFLGIILVYGGLDPLLPSSFHDSAAPRTVYFSLPIVFWIIVEGIHAIRTIRIRWFVLVVFMVLQGIGLFHLLRKDLIGNDWPAIAAQINSATTQKPSIIWTDGMADGPAQYYFGKTATIQNAYSLLDQNGDPKPEVLETALKGKRFIFLAFDSRDRNRCNFSSLLSALSTNSNEVVSLVDYPIALYAFDSGPQTANEGISIPRSIFPMAFQDLKLPQLFTWQNQRLAVGGVYTLPNCQDATLVNIPIMQNGTNANARSLLLVSNLTQADKVRNGSTVAQLRLVTDSNDEQIILLRKGYETQSWDGSCVDTCRSIGTWHKRIALVGNASFPEAYKDFPAQIWGVEIQIPSKTIRSIQLKLLDGTVHLNLYGLYFLPVPE